MVSSISAAALTSVRISPAAGLLPATMVPPVVNPLDTLLDKLMKHIVVILSGADLVLGQHGGQDLHVWHLHVGVSGDLNHQDSSGHFHVKLVLFEQTGLGVEDVSQFAAATVRSGSHQHIGTATFDGKCGPHGRDGGEARDAAHGVDIRVTGWYLKYFNMIH